MISVRSSRVACCRQAAQIDQRVALTGDALVELDDDLGRGRPLLAHRHHGVGDLVEVVQVLVPERMTNSLLGEQAAAAGLRPEVHESGVGTVHRDPERHGEVTLELRRVVGDEVAERPVRDQAGDAAEEPGPFEQLLTERPGRAVADGDERQAGLGVAGDDAGEQGEVVLDDGGGDRRRRHVHHAQAWLAQQQQEEQEALLVRLRHAAAALAEAVERDRGDDHHGLVLEVQAHRVPHARHVALEAVEALVALLLVERRQADRVRRAGRDVDGAHDGTRAVSRPLTSNARTGRLKPFSSRSPTGEWTTRSSAPLSTRWRDEDLPRLRHRAQAGGEVDDGADRRVLDAALEPDAAERRVALGDADTEGEIVAVARPRLGEVADPRAHRDGHADGPQAGVLARHRIVEHDHQTVAGEPLERALVAEDQVAERAVVLAQHRHELLGLARLGERGELPEVAEHDHDLAAVALEDGLVAGVDDELGHLRRQEAAEAGRPLERRDLRLDALLQLTVPRLQLGGLPADRVLVALDPNERLDPGEQLGLVERLGDEVVGPGFDRPDLLLGVARRDHHDRQVGGLRVLADPPAHLVAVHARHHDVEQDDVGRLLAQHVQRLLAGRGGQHPIAARAQHRVEQPDVRRLVVDDEDRRLIAPLRPPDKKPRTCAGSSRTLNGFST